MPQALYLGHVNSFMVRVEFSIGCFSTRVGSSYYCRVRVTFSTFIRCNDFGELAAVAHLVVTGLMFRMIKFKCL